MKASKAVAISSAVSFPSPLASSREKALVRRVAALFQAEDGAKRASAPRENSPIYAQHPGLKLLAQQTAELARSRGASALLKAHPHHRQWLENYARAQHHALSDVRYLPVMAREDWVAIVTPQGQIAQFLKGDGFL